MGTAEREKRRVGLVAEPAVKTLEEIDQGAGVVSLLVEPGDRRAVGFALMFGAVWVHEKAEQGHLAGHELVEVARSTRWAGVGRLGELAAAGVVVEVAEVEVGELVGHNSRGRRLIGLLEQPRGEDQ